MFVMQLHFINVLGACSCWYSVMWRWGVCVCENDLPVEMWKHVIHNYVYVSTIMCEWSVFPSVAHTHTHTHTTPHHTPPSIPSTIGTPHASPRTVKQMTAGNDSECCECRRQPSFHASAAPTAKHHWKTMYLLFVANRQPNHHGEWFVELSHAARSVHKRDCFPITRPRRRCQRTLPRPRPATCSAHSQPGRPRSRTAQIQPGRPRPNQDGPSRPGRSSNRGGSDSTRARPIQPRFARSGQDPRQMGQTHARLNTSLDANGTSPVISQSFCGVPLGAEMLLPEADQFNESSRTSTTIGQWLLSRAVGCREPFGKQLNECRDLRGNK